MIAYDVEPFILKLEQHGKWIPHASLPAQYVLQDHERELEDRLRSLAYGYSSSLGYFLVVPEVQVNSSVHQWKDVALNIDSRYGKAHDSQWPSL